MAVLVVLFVGSQFESAAHAEIDCEHGTCSLCVGSSADSALIGDPAQPIDSPYGELSESPPPIDAHLTHLPSAQLIRGPPET